MTTVLVLGGARSGKSRCAERLLADHPRVRYLATGPVPDGSDPEWAARVQAHRQDRPRGWQTVETVDLAEAIAAAETPVLVDCLGTWLTRLIDQNQGWEQPDRIGGLVQQAAADLTDALAEATQHVVLVSNEVGWGVVPSTASGRAFRDALGRLNTTVADVCERLLLVVSGRVLEVSHAPPLSDVSPLPVSGR